MKTRFLFPYQWRTTGYVLFSVGLIMHILNLSNVDPVLSWPHLQPLIMGFDSRILVNDVEYVSVVLGLLLIGFSKEKIEDEQIAQLRLDSLQWAVYFNYCIIIVCIIFINGVSFLDVLAYNVMSPLLFFVIRFRWKNYRINLLPQFN